MSTGFALDDLAVPVVLAPMAGGPSTPELAAAVTNADGLGFVAGGYLTAEALAEKLSAARHLTTGPLGVNLFVPQPSTVSAEVIARYAAALTADADRYHVTLGSPCYSDDNWLAKLDAVLDLRPEVVSFTFGIPTAEQCRTLTQAHVAIMATVTTVHEAELAVHAGADVLVAQGRAAGGHRGTYDPTATPATEPLTELVTVLSARFSLPVIAAGGLSSRADIDTALSAGAIAAQLGTMFLLADEAGTNPVQRAALLDSQFTETVVTKAFSGRYARGLRNRFINDHDHHAPIGYPEINSLTGPLRAASVRAGDPHATSLWAGTGFQNVKPAPAAAIVRDLA
jgi:nitronate monooxygenase